MFQALRIINILQITYLYICIIHANELLYYYLLFTINRTAINV